MRQQMIRKYAHRLFTLCAHNYMHICICIIYSSVCQKCLNWVVMVCCVQ